MSTLPWRDSARTARLLQALSERILVLDGAMGTMIQRHSLSEADYRGERFAQGLDARQSPPDTPLKPEVGESKGAEVLKIGNDFFALRHKATLLVSNKKEAAQ